MNRATFLKLIALVAGGAWAGMMDAEALAPDPVDDMPPVGGAVLRVDGVEVPMRSITMPSRGFVEVTDSEDYFEGLPVACDMEIETEGCVPDQIADGPVQAEVEIEWTGHRPFICEFRAIVARTPNGLNMSPTGFVEMTPL